MYDERFDSVRTLSEERDEYMKDSEEGDDNVFFDSDKQTEPGYICLQSVPYSLLSPRSIYTSENIFPDAPLDFLSSYITSFPELKMYLSGVQAFKSMSFSFRVDILNDASSSETISITRILRESC
jgi:hypothetical protein